MPSSSWMDRLQGKVISLRRQYGLAPQAEVAALRRFERALESAPQSIGHILYGEQFLRYLPALPDRIRSRIAITLHQPPSQWTPALLAALASVRSVILLYSRDRDVFAKYVSGNVTTILHGVDVDFFCSDERIPSGKRVLYSGVHLRDTALLRDVVERVVNEIPDVAFDFLVPEDRRTDEALKAASRIAHATWHAGLTDEELRGLYRRSTVMLLPLRDAGANTAVVEALSMGLPIVTTDVGGIRDYGGGARYPVASSGDSREMAELVVRYLRSQEAWRQASKSAREFAVSHLAWPGISHQHTAFYSTISR